MKKSDYISGIKAGYQRKRPFESYGLNAPYKRRTRRLRLWIWEAILSIMIIAGIWYEMHTSFFQSWFLSKYAEKLSYDVKPGPSEDIVFPKEGPFNKRRGYDRIPDFRRRLEARNYYVTEQARFSPELVEITRKGVTPPYHEGPTAGLVIRDAEGMIIYDAASKRSQVFERFEDIPPLIIKSLLYIEDRELDNPIVPYSNPVVNWDRLAMAGILYGANKVGLPVRVEGGSTLATQLEKYRYSPHGITSSVFEKLRQMTAASLRVYKEGSDTRSARRKIILDYINTAPLAAVPSYGEIYGIGEGFYAWFGMNLDDVCQALFSPEPDEAKVQTFKRALTLLCSVRAPSYYIIHNYPALEKRVAGYIQLFEKEGIIDKDFADRLRQTPVVFSHIRQISAPMSSAMRKGVNAIRTKLTRTLGISGYYDLDRLDLEADATINTGLQNEVAEIFQKLKQPDFLKENGLKAHRLLADGDPAKVIYSFLLFESTPYGNFLRVHADNLRKPFDINRGSKLILGSTAKLRTLANYLEIVGRLYREFSVFDAQSLKKVFADASDPITRWAAGTLLQNKSLSMGELLEMALDRTYSANPDENFFTGGGIHKFRNFLSRDNRRIISVREATVHSINLVYIRLMRDLVRFHRARLPYSAKKVLADTKNPDRIRLLEEIADDEAKQHLRGFYKRFRKLSPEEILSRLLKKHVSSPRHLALVFFAWNNGADEGEFTRWMKERKTDISPAKIRRLAYAYGKSHFNLSDYGFLLKKHPLEVWCAGELIRNTGSSWKKIVEKSTAARRICSSWLLQPKMKKPQDIRLRTRIEKDSFEDITISWRKLGFPFKRLVPSYSTSIGSSCDQPAALSELIGIIVNDGIRRPAVSIRKLRVADNTPYHTVFELSSQPGERVMETAVARALRKMLQAVVEKGTARRARGAFSKPDGTPVPVGGKTGTGDNRYKEFTSSGEVISSKALNRTATFAFFIGDRYFGVVTAYVSGTETKDYTFTSSLPVSILKLLSPAINTQLARKTDLSVVSGQWSVTDDSLPVRYN
ncbi:transglycosylase domain-containing protein [Desulfococcaceae bacterium HSG8]|nr:transglycosylase domain-containing protein [Desulfococcaceae bacterium HSG8]